MKVETHRALNQALRAIAREDHRSRLVGIKQLPQMLASAIMEAQTIDAALEAMDALDRSCQREYSKLLEISAGELGDDS
jgi:hypothetical protein